MDTPQQDPEKQIQSVFDKTLQTDQFDLSPIAAHSHNNVDSLAVSFDDLSNKFFIYTYVLPGSSAATASNYSVFFIAPFPMIAQAFSEAHTSAGSDPGVVTLNIEKLTGTTAPGFGTNLLSTAFNLKATANTVQNGVLLGQIAKVNLNTGDRLALVRSGTLTSLANVAVSYTLGF